MDPEAIPIKMDPGKKRLLFDINKAGSSFTKSKLKPILEEKEPSAATSAPSIETKSFFDGWDTFKEQEKVYTMANPSSFESRRDPQNTKSPIEEKSFATLHRLENEDVVDRNNVLHLGGSEYFEVIDPELKAYFKDTFGQIDKLQHTTNKFVYIGREERIFRKPVQTSNTLHDKEKAEVHEDDSITLLSSKLAQQSFSNEQASSLEPKIDLSRNPSDNEFGARQKTTIFSPRKRSQDLIQPPKLDTFKQTNHSPRKRSEDSIQHPKLDTFKTISPPVGWTNDIYNDIITANKNDDEIVNHKYIEAKFLNKKPARRLSFREETEKENDFTFLSAEYLEQLSSEVNELKKKELDTLKDKYLNAVTTFNVSNSQYMLSRQVYDLEKQKPNDRDEAFIASHLSLKKSILDQTTKLKSLKTQIEDLASRKSPYYQNEIPMPKLGKMETFNPEQIKLYPIIASDEDISIKDLFTSLCPWAEDQGLSERALKMAIQSRLRGSRLKAWFQYQKQPLKEAITSLSLLFDKSESPMKYANQIKDFRKLKDEDIQNSVERLMGAVNKYLENRSDHDRKVLRLEILKEKLEKLLSARAQREIFRKIEEKHQLGEEITEKELISSIYKEDTFDKRSEARQSYISLQNVNINHNDIEDSNSSFYGDLCEDFNELELNAAEHKRRADIPSDERQSFKHARTHDRPILNPVRKQNPVVIGNQGKPLIKVGNPNPNNRWHNRTNTLQSERLHPSIYNPRREFMNSRNAPLEQQNEKMHQPSYNPKREFTNSINEASEQQNVRYQPTEYYYTNKFRGGNKTRNYQPTNYGNRAQFRQNRNGFTPNRPGLKHNLQFRTNPPEIQQRIALEELNSICVECPKEEGQHTVGQCPFHMAPNQTGQT